MAISFSNQRCPYHHAWMSYPTVRQYTVARAEGPWIMSRVHKALSPTSSWIIATGWIVMTTGECHLQSYPSGSKESTEMTGGISLLNIEKLSADLSS